MATLQALKIDTNRPKESANQPISYILLSLAFLITSDLGARMLYQFRPDLWPVSSYDSPNRSPVWWSANDLKNLSQAPDIVLFGSSLINTAVLGAEATYLQKPIDACLDHRSTYLEKQLCNSDRQKHVVFSLAVPGQMASDAYALASTLLAGNHKPKSIIWGIAPRDFIDCELHDVTSTETYRLMSRIRNLSELQAVSKSSFWDSLETKLGQLSFLYAHKSDFVFLQHKFVNQLIANLEHKDLDEIKLPVALRKDALYECPEDRAANEQMIMPYDANHPLFTDNTGEYRWRYREFRPKAFATQLACLKYMTKYAHNNGIDLFVVNMPLLPENLALLPESTYLLYLKETSKAVVQGGGHFINLQNPQLVQKQNYLDSAHLNGIGGEKLLNSFAELTSERTQLASTRNSQL